MKKTAYRNWLGSPWTDRILYGVCLIASAYTVLQADTYHTLDGPAHLYNTHLLKQFVFGNADFLQPYIELNSAWVPNYTTPVLLGILSLVMPLPLAHTLLLLTVTCLPPFVGRAILKQLNIRQPSLGILLFPLAFSGAFQTGFYNFSLGLLGWLLFTWFWLRQTRVTWKHALINLVLLLVLFLTHAYLFAIAGLTLFLLTLQRIYQHWQEQKFSFKQVSIELTWVGISSLFPLILFWSFWRSHPSWDESFLSPQELYNNLLSLSSLVSYHIADESGYLRTLSIGLFALFSISLYRWIQARLEDNAWGKSPRIIFLVLAGILLLFYLSMPDSVGYASFLSNRHQLLFVYCIIFWVSAMAFPTWIRIPFGILIVYAHLSLLGIVRTYMEPFHPLTADLQAASQVLPAECVIMPVNHSMRWESGHASNYLGMEGEHVILDNYELTVDYFPLMWNHASFPNMDTTGIPCMTGKSQYSLPAGSGRSEQPTHWVYFSDDPRDWRKRCPELDLDNALFETPHVVIVNASEMR